MAKIGNPGAGRPLVDFVCQSSMGPSEGGLETWAYQFLPGLLQLYPDARLRFYGALPESRENPGSIMKQAAGADHLRIKPEFFPITPGKVPQIVSMIRQFLARKRGSAVTAPDIVITAGTFLELIMVQLSPATRRAFKVAWLRTIWVDQKTYRIPAFLRDTVRGIEARILRGADLVLANGSDIAERYGDYGVAVQVIHNAVDTDRWRAPPPALGDPIRVAFVGRLAIDKGIVAFIELARVVRGGPLRDRVSFEVYGHLGEEALVAAAKVEGVVAWSGAVDNAALPRVLSGIDVCAALTYSDQERGGGGTSNAMMEQLAAGRILLAWDNPIFRQWLNTDNAYLARQGDVAGLAACLGAILADRDEALRRAENGRNMMAEFGIAAMMTKFDRVLRAGLADRGLGKILPEF
ncbi:MAG: glycosyltransferase family 4 protein [Novosphingobium sp.]|nr:glycosyltransferase family 4 protein [Novosphingobium sp.]